MPQVLLMVILTVLATATTSPTFADAPANHSPSVAYVNGLLVDWQ